MRWLVLCCLVACAHRNHARTAAPVGRTLHTATLVLGNPDDPQVEHLPEGCWVDPSFGARDSQARSIYASIGRSIIAAAAQPQPTTTLPGVQRAPSTTVITDAPIETGDVPATVRVASSPSTDASSRRIRLVVLGRGNRDTVLLQYEITEANATQPASKVILCVVPKDRSSFLVYVATS